MKLLFSLLLFTSIIFSQNQFQIIVKDENSILLKGTISGSPVTLFLENKKITDCDMYDNYIDGWYYYDKYKIKIYLTGFSNQCDMKLFNYGKNQVPVQKNITKDYISSSKIDSLYENSKYEEKLSFDRCINSNIKGNTSMGVFDYKNKKSEIIIHSNNIFIGNHHEYVKLPNGTQIDLAELFSGYGGNTFYSSFQDNNETRVIYSFHGISNHNYCGRCGASNGEIGFRILYFDRNWKIIKKEEFKTESCLESLYDTKLKKLSNTLFTYTIKDSDDKVYYLNIDKQKSKIIRTK